MINLIEGRKLSHIKICSEEDVQARNVSAGFEDVLLVHRALPEISIKEVDTSTEFFGHRFSAPILIESMTGGVKEAAKINAALAEAAETIGLPMGIGSQRAAIENSNLIYTYKIARDKAPNAFLIANLGVAQLTRGYGLTEAQRAVDMIDADALALHLNPLHEAVQPEGEGDYGKALSRIKEIAERLSVPVIIKETGAGIAAEEARMIEDTGVKGIDVGGAGGTSWAAVECYRARALKDRLHEKLGEDFWDWGIPTAVSVVEAHLSTKLKVIASGGVRTGIDAAKAIALGADVAGLAFPLLKPALEGAEKVVESLRILIEEIKVVMFLTGSKTIDDLKNSSVVIAGKTAEWLRTRGFDTGYYARRRI